MSELIVRPWGLLPWVLSKLPKAEWLFLGCLGCDERCLTALSTLIRNDSVSHAKMLIVRDPQSRYSMEADALLIQRRKELLTLAGGAPLDVEEHALFERQQLLVDSIGSFTEAPSSNMIVDVSSFPKRFFFPILRMLVENTNIHNLIITYTEPASYCPGVLADNPEPWQHIPLFAPRYPEEKVQGLIIGAGFEVLGLPELVEHEYHNVDIRLLFPFPPGPPAYQRTWECVRAIEERLGKRHLEPTRIDSVDVSDAFDHICAATDQGKRYFALAPYGPKPLSVAMCLYAISANCPVFYTQPTAYNPQYCSGIRMVDGLPKTHAYCVRIKEINRYQLH